MEQFGRVAGAGWIGLGRSEQPNAQNGATRQGQTGGQGCTRFDSFMGF